MLLRKEGLPEENEVVLCTVANVHPHYVFVTMDEYDKQGMIHISEIAPGRIRNIRDYVKEGKKVVCKVLRINLDKGHIDLSLRRVNEAQRRSKMDEIKKEQLAESILEALAKQTKKELVKLYAEVTDKLFETYSSLYEPFHKVSRDELDLVKAGLDKQLAKELTEAIKQRIKPPVVQIEGEMKLHSFQPAGVEDIHQAFALTKKVKGEYHINYKGGGNYRFVVTAEEYKTAERVLDELVTTVTKEFTKRGGVATFARLGA